MRKLFFQNKNEADWLSPEIFEVLFQEYWENLFGFCHAHIQDEESAREIVQEIFLSLWERRSVLSINVNIGHYLFGAARFKIARYHRDLAMQRKHSERLAEKDHYITNNTEESIFFCELNTKLQELINKLSDRSREVYIMSRNKGLSIGEIANELNLSEKTVEAHLTKALKYLKAEVSSLHA